MKLMHRESESIIITPGRQVLAVFSSVCRLIDTYAQYRIIVKNIIVPPDHSMIVLLDVMMVCITSSQNENNMLF